MTDQIASTTANGHAPERNITPVGYLDHKTRAENKLK
jgi:hypothetical protein